MILIMKVPFCVISCRSADSCTNRGRAFFIYAPENVCIECKMERQGIDRKNAEEYSEWNWDLAWFVSPT